MFCPNCGHETDQQKFCTQCGKRIDFPGTQVHTATKPITREGTSNRKVMIISIVILLLLIPLAVYAIINLNTPTQTAKKADGVRESQNSPALSKNDTTATANQAEALQDLHAVTVNGDSGSFELPLIGVPASYGFTPQTTPSTLPNSKLPDINFNVPADLADKLAVGWVNLGNGDNTNGLTFIVPRAWKTKQAAFGADGSSIVTLQSASGNSPQSVTFRQDGANAGSSIGDIGTYFPKLRDWAQQNNPVPTPINTIPGIHIVPIDQHTVAYSFKRTSDMYETNGVAIENHNTAQIFFANAEITSPDKEIARTVLNYYLYTLKQIRKAN